MGDPLAQFPRVPDGAAIGDTVREYPDNVCMVNQMSVGVTSAGLVAFAFEAGVVSTVDASGTPRYHAIQFVLPPHHAARFGHALIQQANAITGDQAVEAEAEVEDDRPMWLATVRSGEGDETYGFAADFPFDGEPTLEDVPADVRGELERLMQRHERSLGIDPQAREWEIVGTDGTLTDDAELPMICPECQEIAHDPDCALVGDGRPVSE